MRTRRSIHTAAKWMAYHNILPERYLKQLHRSQICRYRNLDYEKYFGNDLFHFSEGIMTIARQSAQNDFDRKVFQAYLQLAITLRSILSRAKHYHKTLCKYKEELTDVVQKICRQVSVEDAASFIGVSVSTLRNWIRQVRIRCSDSVVNLCRKVHPNQLLASEVEAMKRLLKDERFQYWPLVSVYHYARNKGLVFMAESTWYGYTSLLGVKRLKPKRSKNYGVSIRATKPNQYWHADVSYCKTKDGIVHYIYSVVDNFSRYPLVVRRSTKLSGIIRAETFREAVKKAIELRPGLDTINLVVDGGSENFNGSVDDFLREVDHIPIHRIRALKDKDFSNSMAEAFFRALKCFYLNHMENKDEKQLDRNLAWVVQDYSEQRPHGALNGLMPVQAYTGSKPEGVSFAKEMEEARQRRVEMNKKDGCTTCRW